MVILVAPGLVLVSEYSDGEPWAQGLCQQPSPDAKCLALLLYIYIFFFLLVFKEQRSFM